MIFTGLAISITITMFSSLFVRFSASAQQDAIPSWSIMSCQIMSHQFISYPQRKFGCLTSLLRIFGSDWNPTEKKSHSKDVSQQRSLTAKKPHSKEVSQQRSLTAKRSHSKEVSQQRNFTAKKSHSKEISMFLREVSHESFVFTSFVLTSSTRTFWDVWHESFAFTSSTFTFWGTSRTKAPLRFHILNFHFLRDVSHESFDCDQVAAISLCWFLSFLAPLHFPFKLTLQKASKSCFFQLWPRDPVLEQVLARRSFCLANVILWASATWCLQIVLEWLHQCCSAFLLRR